MADDAAGGGDGARTIGTMVLFWNNGANCATRSLRDELASAIVRVQSKQLRDGDANAMTVAF